MVAALRGGDEGGRRRGRGRGRRGPASPLRATRGMASIAAPRGGEGEHRRVMWWRWGGRRGPASPRHVVAMGRAARASMAATCNGGNGQHRGPRHRRHPHPCHPRIPHPRHTAWRCSPSPSQDLSACSPSSPLHVAAMLPIPVFPIAILPILAIPATSRGLLAILPVARSGHAPHRRLRRRPPRRRPHPHPRPHPCRTTADLKSTLHLPTICRFVRICYMQQCKLHKQI
jgi:hypothetical protein